MKKHLFGIIVGFLIIALLLLYMVFFTVRKQEKALVLTFGKISAPIEEAGLHFMLPWQKNVVFDCRIRTLENVAKEVPTRDKQNVIPKVFVNWRISDPVQFYSSFSKDGSLSAGKIEHVAEKTMRGWISGAINDVFAMYDFAELVTTDIGKFKLPATERGSDGNGGMLALIKTKMSATKEGYGIEILDVGIKKFGIPDLVSGNVFDRMTADRMAKIEENKSKGMSTATTIKAKATSEAAMITATAQAKAMAIKSEGDAQAAKSYARLRQHPELANFLRQLKTLRETLVNKSTWVIDPKSSPAYILLQEGPVGLDGTVKVNDK